MIFGGCDNSKDLQDLYLLELSMKYWYIEINKWKRLFRMENQLNETFVGHKMISIPPESQCITQPIVIFGGWNGKTYTNKMTLIDDSNFS